MNSQQTPPKTPRSVATIPQTPQTYIPQQLQSPIPGNSCPKLKMWEFPAKHYTYINQIMGDATIRQCIAETFPNPKLNMVSEYQTEGEFANTHHHIITTTPTKQNPTPSTICSVEKGYQDLSQNTNDTLCQSYALLTYFGRS